MQSSFRSGSCSARCGQAPQHQALVSSLPDVGEQPRPDWKPFAPRIDAYFGTPLCHASAMLGSNSATPSAMNCTAMIASTSPHSLAAILHQQRPTDLLKERGQLRIELGCRSRILLQLHPHHIGKRIGLERMAAPSAPHAPSVTEAAAVRGPHRRWRSLCGVAGRRRMFASTASRLLITWGITFGDHQQAWARNGTRR